MFWPVEAKTRRSITNGNLWLHMQFVGLMLHFRMYMMCVQAFNLPAL